MALSLAEYLPSLTAIAISIVAILTYAGTTEELTKLVSAIIALVGVMLSLLLANWLMLTGLIILVFTTSSKLKGEITPQG